MVFRLSSLIEASSLQEAAGFKPLLSEEVFVGAGP